MLTAESDSVSLVFAALADPTRRGILEQLKGGSASAGDLAQSYSISGPAISKHLKVLEEAGLIEVERQAQKRVRRLKATTMRQAFDWMQPYEEFWKESFDRLQFALDQMPDEETE